MKYSKKILGVVLLLLLLVSSAKILESNSRYVFSPASSYPSKRKLPIYSVKTDEKKVSISFDAAWGCDDTDEILKILRDNDVKATFFLCGYWVKKYPDVVKSIAAEGHDIGNHGDTHAHGASLSLEQNKKEIMGVHEKVKELLGIEMNLYRPPYGEYNNTVMEAAIDLNYYTIQWDIETNGINIL